jgi:hypothetical protein
MRKMFRSTIAAIALCLIVAGAATAPGSAVETAAASPTAASGATLAKTIPAPSVSLTLGTPRQIFHLHQPDAMGLFNMPDMHTAVLMQPDGSYLLWITGDIGPNGKGSIAMLSTKDFLTYRNAGPGTSTRAGQVFSPSCPGVAGASSCWQNIDADYVGANAVFTAANGRDLLMFYEAGNRNYGPNIHGPEYNVIALARSTDNGRTWTRQGPVISGTDPKPETQSGVGTTQPGVSEPGAIIANGYIYMFFQYIPNENSEPEAPSVIQVARAPVSGDGAPGTWTKFYNGSFGSQSGLGGLGSTIVATGQGSGCTRPVQVWPVFNTYLNRYILFYLCNEGWFYSTSTNLITWTPPMQFLNMSMWHDCQPMDLNYILVTPGSPGGVIGRTGYVLYASTPSHGGGCPTMVSHELWIRPFTFAKSQ